MTIFRILHFGFSTFFLSENSKLSKVDEIYKIGSIKNNYAYISGSIRKYIYFLIFCNFNFKSFKFFPIVSIWHLFSNTFDYLLLHDLLLPFSLQYAA